MCVAGIRNCCHPHPHPPIILQSSSNHPLGWHPQLPPLLFRVTTHQGYSDLIFGRADAGVIGKGMRAVERHARSGEWHARGGERHAQVGERHTNTLSLFTHTRTYYAYTHTHANKLECNSRTRRHTHNPLSLTTTRRGHTHIYAYTHSHARAQHTQTGTHTCRIYPHTSLLFTTVGPLRAGQSATDRTPPPPSAPGRRVSLTKALRGDHAPPHPPLP